MYRNGVLLLTPNPSAICWLANLLSCISIASAIFSSSIFEALPNFTPLLRAEAIPSACLSARKSVSNADIIESNPISSMGYPIIA